MRPAQIAAKPLMASTSIFNTFVEVSMGQGKSVRRQSARKDEPTREVMSAAERVRLAAFVAAGALVMGIVGLLADRSRGILGTVGLVLMAFAVAGVAQAAGIAWGFFTPDRGAVEPRDD
jgi:hypothetical protein